MIDPAEFVRDVRLPSGDVLIGDRWEADTSGDRRDHIDPSTGALLASVAVGGATEIDRAIIAASAAFAEWSQWPPARRRDVLAELHQPHWHQAASGGVGVVHRIHRTVRCRGRRRRPQR